MAALNSFMGFVACLVCLAVGDRIRFDGCVTWEVSPQNERQLQHLQILYGRHSSLETEMKEQKIYFWNEPRRQSPDQVLVCPRGRAEFQNFLKISGIKAKSLGETLQRTLDGIFSRFDTRHEVSTFAYDDNDYNSYEDTVAQLGVLQAACSPEVQCSIDTIGTSYQGRAILRFNIRKEGENRPAVWLDALMHAREWITGPTVMGILTKLVRDYGIDDEVTHLVDNYNFYFVPVVNPDGYSYSWNEFLMWRKNRAPNEGSLCTGTDPNRNFDYFWDAPGASDNPCMENYRGPAPDTQLETLAAERGLLEVADEVVIVLAFHSWGHVYLFPFGHTVNGTCYRSPDYDDLFRVGDACVRAITETYGGEVWEAGTSCELFYEGSGHFQDWARASGVKYTYTPELRPDYEPPPPTEIPPSVVENWNGLVAMVAEYEVVENRKV